MRSTTKKRIAFRMTEEKYNQFCELKRLSKLQSSRFFEKQISKMSCIFIPLPEIEELTFSINQYGQELNLLTKTLLQNIELEREEKQFYLQRLDHLWEKILKNFSIFTKKWNIIPLKNFKRTKKNSEVIQTKQPDFSIEHHSHAYLLEIYQKLLNNQNFFSKEEFFTNVLLGKRLWSVDFKIFHKVNVACSRVRNNLIMAKNKSLEKHDNDFFFYFMKHLEDFQKMYEEIVSITSSIKIFWKRDQNP